MILYVGYIQSSGVSMWGSSWSRPFDHLPTRLRSGLGLNAGPMWTYAVCHCFKQCEHAPVLFGDVFA